MSAIADRYGADSQGATKVASGLRWDVDAVSVAMAEQDWRALQASGLTTPYQSFDWVAAFAKHALGNAGQQARVVRVRNRAGDVEALLPLQVQARFGIRTASFIGGKHANFHMPVMTHSFAAAANLEDVLLCLRNAAAALGGVDAFLFRCQPIEWCGLRNPFSTAYAQPSPSQAYKLALLNDCEATLRVSMSSHARKKHKNKRSRFAELGASRVFVAKTEMERQRVLDMFFRQKALRFAQMRVPDPFDDPGIRNFVHSASQPAGGQEPALKLYGLELDGRLVATYIGAVHGDRFSGMATSYEPDPRFVKMSPGEILLVDVIREECRAGRKMFDLGVGEARYKTTICNATEDLVDGFIPITLKGRIAADVSRRFSQAKGFVKRRPAIYGMLQKLRPARPAQDPG